jgi:hypothetical protein
LWRQRNVKQGRRHRSPRRWSAWVELAS